MGYVEKNKRLVRAVEGLALIAAQSAAQVPVDGVGKVGRSVAPGETQTCH